MTLRDFRVAVPEGRSGPWRVERFEVVDGWKRLSYGARAPDLGTYTRLIRDGDWDPTMSDTPAEVADHLDFISRAHGRLLINGLGLGLVVQAVLRKLEVTSVDVVEIDKDVANLVWGTYANDPRAHLHLADAFTITWSQGTRWDCAWHDIWSSISTDTLPEMTRLKRKYSRKVEWQGVWAEDLLRGKRRKT